MKKRTKKLILKLLQKANENFFYSIADFRRSLAHMLIEIEYKLDMEKHEKEKTKRNRAK